MAFSRSFRNSKLSAHFILKKLPTGYIAAFPPPRPFYVHLWVFTKTQRFTCFTRVLQQNLGRGYKRPNMFPF
jgi:hypothetical protein